MFNNPFLKNDPLLEAVKAAQADGEARRAAEAIVNEEFGVYSRKAVIRENLAAYDAAIEEVYTALKEGKLADKDYDKDGKIESGKAEYQGSRIRAAKMAGKLKEEEQIDEVSKGKAISTYRKRENQSRSEYNDGWGSEGQDPNDDYGDRSGKKASKTLSRIGKKFGSKTTAHAKHAADVDSNGRGHGGGSGDYLSAKERVYSKFSRPNSKKGTKQRKDYMSMNKGSIAKEETDYSAQDRAPVTKSAPKEDPSLPKSYPGAASSAPTASRLSNAKAAVSPIKEEQIDEISKEMAGRYIKKAHYRGGVADFKHGQISGRELATQKRKSKGDQADARKYSSTVAKREKGIEMATDKLTGKAKVQANEEAMNEAAYSAKAGRAGKDLGKPGKNFAKIAAKAGEKYGSEERGNKVAGAILKKIRAKHMKEDSSF